MEPRHEIRRPWKRHEGHVPAQWGDVLDSLLPLDAWVVGTAADDGDDADPVLLGLRNGRLCVVRTGAEQGILQIRYVSADGLTADVTDDFVNSDGFPRRQRSWVFSGPNIPTVRVETEADDEWQSDESRCRTLALLDKMGPLFPAA